jgi:hypothetical protein
MFSPGDFPPGMEEMFNLFGGASKAEEEQGPPDASIIQSVKQQLIKLSDPAASAVQKVNGAARTLSSNLHAEQALHG